MNNNLLHPLFIFIFGRVQLPLKVMISSLESYRYFWRLIPSKERQEAYIKEAHETINEIRSGIAQKEQEPTEDM